MKTLHSLHSVTSAWVWGYVTGGNGHLITPWPGQGYYATHHLYRIDRGHPHTPVTARQPGFDQRRYWRPWASAPDSVETRLTPLCGRLRTRSQNPSFTFGRASTHHCENCTRIASQRLIEPTIQEDLVGRDPWVAISFEDRWRTVDPVSEL